MVARTTALNSLRKGIFPQLHQPLPLGRRESEKLLGSITGSFRKNLDKEHPWPLNRVPVLATVNSVETIEKSNMDASQNSRPTDRHLGAILSNPLFSEPKQSRTLVDPRSRARPLDHFDEAVSKGLMTTRRAAGILQALRSQIDGLSTQETQRAMAESGAGLRVVQWLRASGLFSNLDFLGDRALVPRLVSFMFAEGLDVLAWDWLSRLGQTFADGKADVSTTPKLRNLLTAIMQVPDQPTGLDFDKTRSINQLFSLFIRASQTLPHSHPVILQHLQYHWDSLSWLATVHAWTLATPSGPLFDNFMDIGRQWNRPLDMAHLELLHPIHPDHKAAVSYLHGSNGRVHNVDASSHRTSMHRRIMSLGIDTFSRLQEIGQESEASWVRQFMAKTFPTWNFSGNLDGDELLQLRRSIIA